MENNRFMQTKFDSMVTNQTMQLVKAIIPYIDNNLATVLGVYIKFIELENTFRVNQNVSIATMNANHKGLESMLEDIKEFLNDGDKETLETLMTVIEMMNMDDGGTNSTSEPSRSGDQRAGGNLGKTDGGKTGCDGTNESGQIIIALIPWK